MGNNGANEWWKDFSGAARRKKIMKIMKIESLLKEDLYIHNVKVENAKDDETTSRLLSHTDIVSCSLEHLSLLQAT